MEAVKNLNVDADEMRVTLNNRSCNVCVGVDQLWICLECRQILCGPNALGHNTAHYEFHKNHCIFINLESAAIFCFKCDSDVVPKNHDDELNRLRQFILYNQGSNANDTKKNPRKRSPPKKSTKPRKKTGRKRRYRSKKKTVGSKTGIDSTELSENDPETVMLKNGLNATPKKIITKKAAKPKKPKKPIFKRGPRTNKKVGITNSGNNCFMNAIWQVLRHLKPFMYCLKLCRTADVVFYNNNDNIAQKTVKLTIGEELWKLLTSLIDWKQPSGKKNRDSISPADLYTIVCKIKPRYKGFHQHDAQEFLMFTLDTLHSELRDEKIRKLTERGTEIENPNKIDTLVSVIFRGTLLSEVFCLNCNTPSRTNDPFSDISLDIPDYKNIEHTETEPRPVDLLTDCLARYIAVEELNENNFYLCSKCESQQKSTKRFWINSLPNVLCLHLKRFRWDTNYRTKVHTHIKFPMNSLDMSQYLDDDKKETLNKDSSYMFDLISVIVHDGEGGGSGHYTAYALDDKDGQWYEYNDEKVHEVDTAMVENLQAYLLFYIKREIQMNLSY